ncbi:hypothetical protein Tco_0656719 [Tanacetum coccineum]|uniref:Uncharacterized protein n=1 Tax=Tanacetum coccineum TaxID=301880 RepID=A0ABQ4X9J6_9ASTR
MKIQYAAGTISSTYRWLISDYDTVDKIRETRKKLDSEFSEEENKTWRCVIPSEIILSQGLPDTYLQTYQSDKHCYGDLEQVDHPTSAQMLCHRPLNSTSPQLLLSLRNDAIEGHSEEAPGMLVSGRVLEAKIGDMLQLQRREGHMLKAEAFLADVVIAPHLYIIPQHCIQQNMFQARKGQSEDAYESDVDEGPMLLVAFMANLFISLCKPTIIAMRIQLKDTITSLRIQLDGLKVENVSLKRRYDELSKANTYSRTAYTEKLHALTSENTKLKALVHEQADHNRKLHVVDHNQFVIRSLKSVNTKTPQAKHSVNHTKKVWKATRNHNVNTTKTAWRPTRKVVGSVKPQWKPTRRHFALYDNCPLTRIVETIVSFRTYPSDVLDSSKVYYDSRIPCLKLRRSKGWFQGDIWTLKLRAGKPVGRSVIEDLSDHRCSYSYMYGNRLHHVSQNKELTTPRARKRLLVKENQSRS